MLLVTLYMMKLMEETFTSQELAHKQVSVIMVHLVLLLLYSLVVMLLFQVSQPLVLELMLLLEYQLLLIVLN